MRKSLEYFTYLHVFIRPGISVTHWQSNGKEHVFLEVNNSVKIALITDSLFYIVDIDIALVYEGCPKSFIKITV